MWYVVDEFGFAVEPPFMTEQEADNSRKKYEETKTAKEWNLKYYLVYQEP